MSASYSWNLFIAWLDFGFDVTFVEIFYATTLLRRRRRFATTQAATAIPQIIFEGGLELRYMSEYYTKLIVEICDIYRYLIPSCFIVCLDFVVPAHRHELRTIGLLLVFLAILIIDNHEGGSTTASDFQEKSVSNTARLGNILLLSSSLLNVVVTYVLLHRGKLYYALVQSSIRACTFCGFASIWILELVPIFRWRLVLVGMVWTSCFLLSVMKTYIEYQRVISADAIHTSGGVVTSYGNSTIGTNERNWHEWSTNQLTAWIVHKSKRKSCVLACILPHSISGAMLQSLTIQDLMSFGLNYGDAFHFYEDIQQLMLRNDGGFQLKEKLRYRRYEYGSNFVEDERVNDIRSSSMKGQYSEERNGEFVMGGIDISNNEQLSEMRERAAELMKSRFGLTLPAITEDTQTDTAVESSSAIEGDTAPAEEAEDINAPLHLSLAEMDQSRVPESARLQYSMPSETLLATMPPEIRKIAQRHPSIVSKILSQKTGIDIKSSVGDSFSDGRDNSLSLLQKIQRKSRQFLFVDDANGKKTDNTAHSSPLFEDTDVADEEMQSLISQQKNPALRRRR